MTQAVDAEAHGVRGFRIVERRRRTAGRGIRVDRQRVDDPSGQASTGTQALEQRIPLRGNQRIEACLLYTSRTTALS